MISEPMKRFRAELDARGIKWYDDTEEYEYSRHEGDAALITHIERTKTIEPRMSVIWGYLELQGKRTYTTYGSPDLLECWDEHHDPDPVPMTVEEIIEKCVEGGS